METLSNNSQRELKRLVDQIERLEEEKKALAGDIRDKFEEAKGLGFDTKILKRVLAIRKQGLTAHAEEEAILASYMHALEGTPLGDWAKNQPKLAAVS